jgi:hypothetical protein
MAITVKHKFVSTIPDDPDATLIRPSNWNDTHDLTGTVPIANGGTNATTAEDALTNLGAYPASNPAGYGTGTVTSVAASVPSFLSVSGSPITTSGTLALTYSGTALPVANGGTGVTTSSGANSVVLRDANVNINANAFNDGYTNTAATGTQIVLTVSSVRRYTITGSGGQTIKLPDATTLVNGEIFEFDNNQSSGAITVNNNSNTLVVSVPSGGLVRVNLLSNSIAAGSWDRHDYAPSNVSWSTNTLDYAGSITSATWNGNVVQVNRGGTGASTLTGLVVGNGTSAMTTVTAPSGTVVGTTDTQTLTNKRINPRVSSTTSTATLTVNSDSFDQAVLTAQAVALSVAAPTGTPVNGQKLTLRFKDNATAQTISWTTTSGGFRVIGCTLPTTTVISKTVYIGCIYNSDDTFWDVVSVGQQI